MKKKIYRLKRGIIQKMNNQFAKYSVGSIMGRAVYDSNKGTLNSSGISIFGTKIYKENKSIGICGNILKKRQK